MAHYALLVELGVFLEVSIGPPLIGPASPPLPVPPPTTLLGALAYPYLREQGVPEVVYVDGKPCSPAVRIIEKVHYASAGFYGRIEQRTLERVIQAFYLREQYLSDVKKLWSVSQRGFTSYADDRLYLFYIVSDPELAKYAYGITRVGRKESIVVVRNVIVKPLEELISKERDGSTIFYTPKNCAKVCEGSFEFKMSKLHKDNLCKTVKPEILEEYYVPGFDGMKCRASDEGVFLWLPVDEVEDDVLRDYPMILVPKDVLGV
ncbi:MAG: type I-A CRISPR-associated protein Cas5a [Thaumarchaeota archaeon]|jgi:CRISPR-associated protein Cas5a/b/c|nr:type I-A CRISPR-associated protein Cas5a [Candidatus Geocrenenecus arthurdayi]